jgi:hypothetical protein
MQWEQSVQPPPPAPASSAPETDPHQQHHRQQQQQQVDSELTFERHSFEKGPLELQVQEDDGRWIVAWVYRRRRNRSSIVLHFGDAVYEG